MLDNATCNSGETSHSFYTIKWLSLVIIKLLTPEQKNNLRKLEVILKRVVKKQKDVKFNLQCLQHGLLPKYTKHKIVINKIFTKNNHLIDYCLT